MGEEDPLDLFEGARRRRSYDEPETGSAESPLSVAGESRETRAPGVPTTPLIPAPPVQSGRRRRRRGFPSAAQQAELVAAETAVGEFTAPRSVNVVVANPKSSGKTSTCLALGGVLAEVRGGGVAITEATPTPGDLSIRAEGRSECGLGELVEEVDQVTTPDLLERYTTRQSSGAGVVGSTSSRPLLHPNDVAAVRRVLDEHYPVTITDTGNDTSAPAFTAALAASDVVVIPVTCSLMSIRGAQEVVRAIARTTAATERDLLKRVVIVASHDGGPEAPELSAQYLELLRDQVFPLAVAVVEVPFDLAIRSDVREFALSNLSQESAYAWRIVARHVVDAAAEAPPEPAVPTARPESHTPGGEH